MEPCLFSHCTSVHYIFHIERCLEKVAASNAAADTAADASNGAGGAAETVIVEFVVALNEELHSGQAVALNGAAEGDVATAAAVVHSAAEGDAAAEEVVLGHAVDVGGVDGGGGADDGGVGELAQDATAALAVEVAGVRGAA